MFYVEESDLYEITLDQHTLYEIQYLNTNKVYDGYGVPLLNSTWVSNYTASGDPNLVDQFSMWWTLFFARFYNVCTISGIVFLLLACLITTKTTLIPVYLILYFT